MAVGGAAAWILWILLALAILVALAKIFKAKVKDWVLATFVILGLFSAFALLTPASTLSFGLGDGAGDGGIPTVSGKQVPIATFKIIAKERYSNDYGVLEGSLRIYDENADPSDANSNPLQQINVVNGKGSDVNSSIVTNKLYRVVWAGTDNSGASYDIDFGKIAFSGNQYDPEQGIYTFNTDSWVKSADGITTYATIDDFCDETQSNTSKSCLGSVNGQYGGNTTGETGGSGATELANAGVAGGGADDTIHYDESVGDGEYTTFFTFSVSGGNKGSQELAFCVNYDATNPPEGNEYSAITVTLDSGTDMGIDSSFLNIFKNEDCAQLGSHKSGTSAVYKFVWSVNEGNIEAADDYTLTLDDLGEDDGKDVLLNRKATKDTFTFGGSQA